MSLAIVWVLRTEYSTLTALQICCHSLPSMFRYAMGVSLSFYSLYDGRQSHGRTRLCLYQVSYHKVYFFSVGDCIRIVSTGTLGRPHVGSILVAARVDSRWALWRVVKSDRLALRFILDNISLRTTTKRCSIASDFCLIVAASSSHEQSIWSEEGTR
jgi:hypothetical protein